MAGEKNLESRLRDKVKKAGGIALKFWCVSFSGIPDRIVLMPGGRIWFVELKSTSKTPKPIQLRAQKMLSKLGFETFTIDTNERLTTFLKHINAS